MRSILVLLVLLRSGQCMKTVMRGGREEEQPPRYEHHAIPYPFNAIGTKRAQAQGGKYAVDRRDSGTQEHPRRPYGRNDDEDLEEEAKKRELTPQEKLRKAHTGPDAFGRQDYLLPENFKTLRRYDIPVTYRLHDDLLRYYRKGTRPVTHPTKIIHVTMSVFLYQIIKLDAVKNTISLSGSFELYWQDEFLQWQPDSYEGATEIFLASQDIWIPEFSLYYSHNFNDAVKMLSNNDVRVNYTGHIRYYIPFSTESLCKLDVKFFPFDIQECELLYGSWAHSNDSIKYSLYSNNISLIDFHDNQEWELDMVKTTIRSDGFEYNYMEPPLFWEMIILKLVVVRQSFYYVFNLVIPSTIITLVAVIGFHTPSTSGRVRDAKFRLGIMTLMSMSVILLAIVEDMPKFTMWNSRKSVKGSYSGIPLIGLYYFILLAIIGLSTVTTSMFVFLERDYRVKRRIPWYLRWLSFDLRQPGFRSPGAAAYRRDDSNGQTERLLSNGHVGDGIKERARGVASTLLGLIPNHQRQPPQDAYQLHVQNDNTPSPRQNIRRRMSISQYDNMILYQYFDQTLEDLIQAILKIERTVDGIRREVVSLVPQDDMNSRWQTVIRRLEVMSLIFYVSIVFVTMFLFFYHDWYCAIGHSPCGQVNLKCPWMVSTEVQSKQCAHNSYNR